MYKKRDARAKLLFCQSKPVGCLPFSLPSPSSRNYILDSLIPHLSLKNVPLSTGVSTYREKLNNPSTFRMFSPAWKLWQIKAQKPPFPGSSPRNEAGWFKCSWLFSLCIWRREVLMQSLLISRAPQYTTQICLFRAFSRLPLFFAPTYSRFPIHPLDCKKRIMIYELFPS